MRWCNRGHISWIHHMGADAMKQSQPKPKPSKTHIHKRIMPDWKKEEYDGSEPIEVEE
jgi:hypothetical protein